ncbi:hypothetical protein RYX36_034176, partial [Vicia faba]
REMASTTVAAITMTASPCAQASQLRPHQPFSSAIGFQIKRFILYIFEKDTDGNMSNELEVIIFRYRDTTQSFSLNA